MRPRRGQAAVRPRTRVRSLAPGPPSATLAAAAELEAGQLEHSGRGGVVGLAQVADVRGVGLLAEDADRALHPRLGEGAGVVADLDVAEGGVTRQLGRARVQVGRLDLLVSLTRLDEQVG